MTKKIILCVITFVLCFVVDANITGANTVDAAIQKAAPKIVLITIDGVRWQDIYNKHDSFSLDNDLSGRHVLPTIYREFIDNGIAVGNSTPAFTENMFHVSQPGYLEIISGYSSRTCFNNYCKPNTSITLLNYFANDAAVIASWETIAKTFDNSLAAVNAGRHIRSSKWDQLNLPNTDTLSDHFDNNEYRGDEGAYEAAMALLHKRQPEFLWISFGDTDEEAHAGDVNSYWLALNAVDVFILESMKLTDPNTVYIVCPDHGRSNNFRDHGMDAESGRVWILMAGAGIPKAGFVSYDRDVYLADIMPTIMGLSKGIPSSRSLLNYRK
jgi:hypothetical protein